MRIVLPVMGLLLLALPARAEGDARQGAGFAQDWCASCHVVGKEEGGRGTDAVPSFASVARNPVKGPDYVRRVLANPHPSMPRMPLSQRAVEDIVAYFRTLQ